MRGARFAVSREVIKGPMFAGKSTELLRKVGCWESIGKRVKLVSHAADVRVSGEAEPSVWTHNRVSMPCTRVDRLTPNAAALLEIDGPGSSPKVDVVAIDEGQFFPDLKDFCDFCTLEGVSVVVAGLSGDKYQRPFGQINLIESGASVVTTCEAFCTRCADGTPAQFSVARGSTSLTRARELEALRTGEPFISVGGNSEYESICNACLRA